MTTDKKKKAKTNITKERLIYVYPSSQEMFNRWKETAEKSNMPLSKFVVEHVTNSLEQEKEHPNTEARIELIEKNRRLEEENQALLKEIREQDSRIEMLEREARSYLVEPFLEPNFEGIREYSKSLIQLFKKERELPKEELYKKLRINPRDTDAVTAIQKQIEFLELYGLLKDVGGFWRWKG